jgi:nucleoid-associated protein EbfC
MRPDGQPTMQDLFEQAQRVQQQIEAARVGLEEAEFTGTAGGGQVMVTMAATGEVRAVRIAPEAVDPDDVAALENLLMAALRDAHTHITQLAQQMISPLTDIASFIESSR